MLSLDERLSHLMHESVRRGCKVASVGRRDKMATPAVQKEGRKEQEVRSRHQREAEIKI